MKIRSVTTLFALLFAAAPALAEKIWLKVNVPPGTEMRFDQTETADMNIGVTMQGQPPQQIQQKTSQKLGGTITVVESKDGVPTKWKLVFDRDCGGTMSQGGQNQPMPFPLAGQTVTVNTEGGMFSADHNAGELGEDALLTLRGYTDWDGFFLPKQPVEVGESWNPDLSPMLKMMQLDPMRDKVNANIKFVGIRDVEGRKAAELETSLNLAIVKDGMNIVRNSQGTTMVDIKTGRVLSTQMAGSMQLTGSQDQGGMQVDVSGKGPIATMMKIGIKDGIGGPVPVPPPIPPAPVVGGAGPSLDGQAFKGEKLSIFFSQGDGGLPSCTIMLGNREFPGTISKWDGQNLAGEFMHESSRYPFTAVVSGDNMTLKTGATEYKLARPAKSSNPLDR